MKDDNMPKKTIRCSRWNEIEVYQNPIPTVDIIIEIESKGIVLIKRKNPPYGWAIPGGFVDYGESLEQAAVREAKEETNLDVKLINNSIPIQTLNEIQDITAFQRFI
jgi:ADP-ribose pyrophosphatase YjhB (NUDIX family)